MLPSMPASNCAAYSPRTRWQKPLMVTTTASSMVSTAWRRRRRSASALSSPDCRRRRSSASTLRSSPFSVSGAGPVGCADGSSRSATQRCRRWRRRVRSSSQAARVNVMTRILRSGTACSTTSRAYNPARVKVLPVPALASISCMPLSGMRSERSFSYSVCSVLMPGLRRWPRGPAGTGVRPTACRRYPVPHRRP